MLNQGLVSYIYENLKKGYELPALRTFLYNQNYNINEIDEAIRYIQYYYPTVIRPQLVQEQTLVQPTQTVQHHHLIEISKSAIFVIIFILLFIPLGIFVVLHLTGGNNSPDKLLDIQTNPLTTSVEPGDYLKFEVGLESYGSAKRFDTTVESRIVNKNNKVINKKQQVMSVETKSSDIINIKVPETTPAGRYTVITEVKYKGITEEVSFMFSVKDKNNDGSPSCFDGVKNQGEKNTDCGGPCDPCQESDNPLDPEISDPSCSDGKKNQGELKTDCGGPCKPCEVSCNNCIPPDFCTDAECLDGECVFSPKEPCCGNYYCEKTETHETCPADCDAVVEIKDKTPLGTKEEARELAKEDAEAAAKLCDGLESGKIRDSCFSDVATESKLSVLCEYIEDISRRDGCYMDAVMNGEYRVCSKISDVHLKTTCKHLKMMASMRPPEGLAVSE